MKKLIGLALMASLAFACGSAAFAAATPDACVSEEAFVKGATAGVPEGLSVTVLKVLHDQDAQTVVTAYNQLPPASAWEADSVVIMHAVSKATGDEHPKWLVALFKDGCKVDAAMIPASLLRVAIGDPA
jgi:hypothetical protein